MGGQTSATLRLTAPCTDAEGLARTLGAMAVLIDPATRPATMTWAAALLAMNGGLFVIPITATSVSVSR
jgi:hypothetical protein